MEDIIIENSYKNSNSNISNSLIKLYEDEIKEAVNMSANVAAYKSLLKNVITRAKAVTDIDKICSVIPTSTPSGQVFSFGNRLSGKESQKTVVTDTLRIFKVQDVSAFTIDGDISTSTPATGTVLYVEPETNMILVKINTGTFSPADDIDNANPFVSAKTSITAIYNASHLLGTILPGYTGTYSTKDGEEIIDYNKIDFKMNTIEVECITRMGHTGLTVEALQDLINTFGFKYRETLVNMLAQIMKELERNDAFRYQRANAFNQPNIVLTNSYGVQGGISSIYGDIYNRVNQSIGSIGTNTGIIGDYSVSASSKVFNGICTYLKGDITVIDGITYLPGMIPMIEDGYSMEEYLCVSLIGPNDNGATIFTPYDISVIEAVNSEDFSKEIKLLDRYDIVDNPLATRVNEQSKNEMMEITYCDFSSLTNEI